jgi:hypothetical protein
VNFLADVVAYQIYILLEDPLQLRISSFLCFIMFPCWNHNTRKKCKVSKSFNDFGDIVHYQYNYSLWIQLSDDFLQLVHREKLVNLIVLKPIAHLVYYLVHLFEDQLHILPIHLLASIH